MTKPESAAAATCRLSIVRGETGISAWVASSIVSDRTRAVFSSHGRTRRVSQTGAAIQSP